VSLFRNATWRRFVYTLWAPVYDVLSRPFAAMRRRSISALALQPGERVLIIGAGTGLDLDHLPPGVAITAIDLTPAMLERLKRRARRRGQTVDARVMNAEAMDFPDGQFDAAILHLILAVTPRPRACAQEAARVLRPGGRAVILDKFIPEGAAPPLAFRLMAPLASAFGTELTRRLGDILEGLPMRVLRDEPLALKGLFRNVLIQKPLPADCDPEGASGGAGLKGRG